jgi:hypothetical protein
MTYKVKITDIRTGKQTQTTHTRQEAIDLGYCKSVEDEAAYLEAEVQTIADQLTQNSERDVAMAQATIDLVIAARDGQLAGLSRTEIRTLYRDRVVTYLRQNKGI